MSDSLGATHCMWRADVAYQIAGPVVAAIL